MGLATVAVRPVAMRPVVVHHVTASPLAGYSKSARAAGGAGGPDSGGGSGSRRRFTRTLTGKTLLRLVAAGSLLLLAAAVFNSYLLYRQSEGEARLRLGATAAERARVAERVLGYTVETHETVRLAFVEKWPTYQDAATTRRFETILERYPDGIWRNRKDLADGRVYPTGWIPRKTPLDEELRRLMVLFWDLSTHYGPGAAIRRDNLFFMGVPDESNLGYDPYLFPNWVFDIPPDFSQLDYEWGRLAYHQARPGDGSRYATPIVDDIGPGVERSLLRYSGRTGALTAGQSWALPLRE